MKKRLITLTLILGLAAVWTCPLMADFKEVPVASYVAAPPATANSWAADPALTKLIDGIVPAAGENWGAGKTAGWELPANSGPTITFDLGQSVTIDAISLTHFGSYYGFVSVDIYSADDPNFFELVGTFPNALLATTAKADSVRQDILLTAPGRHIKMAFISGEPGYANAWTMLSEVEFYQLDPNTIIIQQQPQDLILVSGNDGELSVVASGKTLPLSYQWKKDGVAIADATEATLLIEAATLDDAGAYSCVVTSPANPVGEETTAAIVQVLSAPPLTHYGMRVLNHDPTVYWSFDEEEGPAIELTSMLGNRMLTASQPSRFPHDGKGSAISVLAFENVFGTTTLDSITTSGPFAIEFWLRLANPTVTNRYIMEIGIPNGAGNLPAVIFGYNPMELEFFQGFRTKGFAYADPNDWMEWHHVVLVDYDDEIEAYDNGALVENFEFRTNTGNYVLNLTQEIAIGSVRKTHASSPASIIEGDIDEVAIYNFAGMTKEAIRARVQAIALHGDLSGPAYITEQPRDTTAPPTTDTVLVAAAAGAEPITYQWKKNGVAIAGANSPVLVLPAVQPVVDDGSYTCYVENTEGGEESQPAILTVACYYDIPGDINNDCIVDLLDLAAVAAHWLESSSVLP
ncbi:MAG: immunoglobulin domain-containing protein [Phycisphaerae bacterium]|nr:immunoglobulin domain-containing protein [Phycisphaerae bacterium]